MKSWLAMSEPPRDNSWIVGAHSFIYMGRPKVKMLVTGGAKGDQVFFRVTALVAAELYVVDLKHIHATAVLAAPTTSPQDCDP